MGICIGMQTLFESSEESPGVAGLGVIPGAVTLFPATAELTVPHIGWNGITKHAEHPALAPVPADAKVYFVHSYRVEVTDANAPYVLATTDHVSQRFVSAVQCGNVFATQFHPEKSGELGVGILRAFLEHATAIAAAGAPAVPPAVLPALPASASAAALLDTAAHPRTRIARRIVAYVLVPLRFAEMRGMA
jgi:glutamine amidotransferase/cyclase